MGLSDVLEVGETVLRGRQLGLMNTNQVRLESRGLVLKVHDTREVELKLLVPRGRVEKFGNRGGCEIAVKVVNGNVYVVVYFERLVKPLEAWLKRSGTIISHGFNRGSWLSLIFNGCLSCTRVMDLRYLGFIVFGLVVLASLAPLAMVVAEEPPRDMPDPVVIRGGWARLTPLLLGFDKAVELAYAIRNLTYDLFQWEISYNVTGARVQFMKAEWFLERALNLSETEPKRATVFAFVAAVHYSHAPALANQVLGRVIRENLGENHTVTEQTVQAVIAVAGELKNLLSLAIEKAKEYGVNTTIAEKLLALGDTRLENATSLLEEGNITIAFRYAVSGYRTYVRAYNALVKATFVKYVKEVEAGFTRALIMPVEPPAKRLLPVLPERVREHVRARIEAGELKNISEVVSTTRELAVRIREQVRLAERRNLEEVLEMKLAEVVENRVAREIVEQVVRELVEKAYQEGYRGIELARRVVEQLNEWLRERIREREIKIPEIPVKPPEFRIQPVPPGK